MRLCGTMTGEGSAGGRVPFVPVSDVASPERAKERFSGRVLGLGSGAAGRGPKAPSGPGASSFVSLRRLLGETARFDRGFGGLEAKSDRTQGLLRAELLEPKGYF